MCFDLAFLRKIKKKEKRNAFERHEIMGAGWEEAGVRGPRGVPGVVLTFCSPHPRPLPATGQHPV